MNYNNYCMRVENYIKNKEIFKGQFTTIFGENDTVEYVEDFFNKGSKDE